ncbi:PEP-CTERM sorting domain-containing protein [Novipirellula artificiosorum]|uniref:PEP-CTERM motif protein n=1 Tax=Novipirellula artificiosorum TaxID=2528016 RepID=A0A5C6DY15_9BACT|nr:PEP-CTERM sorting domain-containing protein [Novipirellula artificiosorum]TWU39729.1 PEP-CTERM motif protein [Novipirellula artificiosorum]
MMKNFNAVLACWAVTLTSPVFAGVIADSGYIEDRYIGGTDHGQFSVPDDSIGDQRFDIQGSSVALSGNRLEWTIHTNFVLTPSALTAQYGDLFFGFQDYAPFLSGDAGLSDGWYGKSDTMASGTQWQNAVQLNDTLTSNGGGVTLYGIDTSNYADAVLASDDFFGSGSIFRNGQEVRVDESWGGNTSYNPLSYTGGWSRDTTNKTLTIYLESADIASLFGLSQDGMLAYHWGMTCGNDVVENSTPFEVTPPLPFGTPTPEPASIAIFGIGAAGLAFSRRRRNAA